MSTSLPCMDNNSLAKQARGIEWNAFNFEQDQTAWRMLKYMYLLFLLTVYFIKFKIISSRWKSNRWNKSSGSFKSKKRNLALLRLMTWTDRWTCTTTSTRWQHLPYIETQSHLEFLLHNSWAFLWTTTTIVLTFHQIFTFFAKLFTWHVFYYDKTT